MPNSPNEIGGVNWETIPVLTEAIRTLGIVNAEANDLGRKRKTLVKQVADKIAAVLRPISGSLGRFSYRNGDIEVRFEGGVWVCEGKADYDYRRPAKPLEDYLNVAVLKEKFFPWLRRELENLFSRTQNNIVTRSQTNSEYKTEIAFLEEMIERIEGRKAKKEEESEEVPVTYHTER